MLIYLACEHYRPCTRTGGVHDGLRNNGYHTVTPSAPSNPPDKPTNMGITRAMAASVDQKLARCCNARWTVSMKAK